MKLIAKFLMEKRINYKGSHAIHPSDNVDEWSARNAAMYVKVLLSKVIY